MPSQATQPASTCPCGSMNFEETATKLEIEVQSVTGSWPRRVSVFMRTCHQCGQVTFWAVSSRPHNTVEPVNPSDLLDGS